MRKIFGVYGIAVVTVFVALVLFSFCLDISFGNRQNLQQIFGIIVQGELDNNTKQNRLGTAFDEIGGQAFPKIELTCADAIIKGQKIALSDFLTAYDRTGAHIGMYLQEIWKEDWTKDASVLCVNDTQIMFERAGIYWLLVGAKDAQGRERESFVKIYVKEG